MKELRMSKEIYTDGGYTNIMSRGIGAWAFIILDVQKKEKKKLVEKSDFKFDTSNNKMELQAGIEALKALETLNVDDDEELELFSDSMYFVRGMNEWLQKWKEKDWKSVTGNDIKNQDLWLKLDKFKSKFPKLRFTWVKGHDSNAYNIECDSLVQEKIRMAKAKLTEET